jgi:hypothetical protein
MWHEENLGGEFSKLAEFDEKIARLWLPRRSPVLRMSAAPSCYSVTSISDTGL